MTGSTPYLGRCPAKGCKHAVRVLVAHERYKRYYGNGASGWQAFDHEGVTDRTRRAATAGVECPDHGRQLRFVAVKGAFNAGVKCNARCTGAVRPDCECSCAGRNHGADHQAVLT